MNDIKETNGKEASTWWRNRRLRYNKGLIYAGLAAFILYCIVGRILIDGFEVTLFTTFFQGIGYLIMMGVANIFYTLGSLADTTFNSKGDEEQRQSLFNIGYWISVLLPFAIPIAMVILHFGRTM